MNGSPAHMSKNGWSWIPVTVVMAIIPIAIVHDGYRPLGFLIRGLVGYHPFSYTMWGIGSLIAIAGWLAKNEVFRGVALTFLSVALLAAFPEGACLAGLSTFATTLVAATAHLRLAPDDQFRRTMFSAMITMIVIIAYLEEWYPATLPVPQLK